VPHAGLSQAGAVTIAKVTGRFRPRTLVANEQATDGESTLRVSPRGDRVAYTRDVQGGGGKEIRIARMDGRTQTFLGSQPSWSPDGTRLAFTSSRFPTSVYVGRPGGRRRWLSAGSRPVWSPDGRWIAFVRGSRCAQINVIRPSGRGRRQVTHEPCGSGFDIWWSPDSKRLIYQRFG
jgi:Tol biopolymer transport system component